MQQIIEINDLRQTLAPWRDAGERIALVPTMGNLHAGHLSLVEQAAARADRVVVSLFVNPTQFGEGEDFDAYPRTPASDLDALRESACDLAFLPTEDQLYPFGPKRAVQVRVPGISELLEGEHRPGHFDGVATVVLRLFCAVAPDVAVFGEKDYQQLQVIRFLVRDLNLNAQILAGPTVRESDGLALSSRNRYLDARERARAPALYRALRQAVDALDTGERDFAAIEARGRAALQAAGLEPDYLAIRAPDLRNPDPETTQYVILGAARLGRIRLIDNISTKAGNFAGNFG